MEDFGGAGIREGPGNNREGISAGGFQKFEFFGGGKLVF